MWTQPIALRKTPILLAHCHEEAFANLLHRCKSKGLASFHHMPLICLFIPTSKRLPSSLETATMAFFIIGQVVSRSQIVACPLIKCDTLACSASNSQATLSSTYSLSIAWARMCHTLAA